MPFISKKDAKSRYSPFFVLGFELLAFAFVLFYGLSAGCITGPVRSGQISLIPTPGVSP